MRVLCVIIARGGSKGLPKKNTLELNGKPLIAHPIVYARESSLITDLIVSTDDPDIARVAREFGASTPFLRPAELSGDSATTESVLNHALLFMENKTGLFYDLCVFLTATDIFRPAGLIEEGITVLSDNPEIESYFVGQKTTKNYWELNTQGDWVRVRNWMSEYSSRQNRNYIVREDTGLMCVSRAQLWRNNRRIGDKVFIKVIDDSFSSIDIHSKDDLELAKAAISIRSRDL